jgi:hypothetical protein
MLYLFFPRHLIKIKVDTSGECRTHLWFRVHISIYVHLSLTIILPMGGIDSLPKNRFLHNLHGRLRPGRTTHNSYHVNNFKGFYLKTKFSKQWLPIILSCNILSPLIHVSQVFRTVTNTATQNNLQYPFKITHKAMPQKQSTYKKCITTLLSVALFV